MTLLTMNQTRPVMLQPMSNPLQSALVGLMFHHLILIINALPWQQVLDFSSINFEYQSLLFQLPQQKMKYALLLKQSCFSLNWKKQSASAFYVTENISRRLLTLMTVFGRETINFPQTPSPPQAQSTQKLVWKMLTPASALAVTLPAPLKFGHQRCKYGIFSTNKTNLRHVWSSIVFYCNGKHLCWAKISLFGLKSVDWFRKAIMWRSVSAMRFRPARAGATCGPRIKYQPSFWILWACLLIRSAPRTSLCFARWSRVVLPWQLLRFGRPRVKNPCHLWTSNLVIHGLNNLRSSFCTNMHRALGRVW